MPVRPARWDVSPTSRNAAQARLSAVGSVLDLRDLLDVPDEPLEERIRIVLADTSRPPAARAAAAVLALTGRYALDEEQEALTENLHASRVRPVLRILDTLVRDASPVTLGRMPVHCPSVIVDLSRSRSSGEVTGIPRVARALAEGASARGHGVVRWLEGAPGLTHRALPVASDLRPAGTARTGSADRPPLTARAESIAQQAYSRMLARLNASSTGSQTARLVRTAASPATAAARRRRAAQGIVILGHCTYVTVEVPVPAVVRRLLPWADVAPDLRLRTVVHDLLPLLAPRYFAPEIIARHAGFASLVSRSDSVIVASEHVADQVPEVARLWGRVDDVPLEILPFGTDAAMWVARPRPRDDRPEFLVVGGLEPRKNHATVLRGLILLAERGLRTTVHLVGNRRPPNAVVARLLREANAAGVRVRLHVGVSDSELAGIMDVCVASIYLSRAEGYGLPPVESIARGLPVVIADLPPVNEHLRLGGVVAVAPDRPDVLAEVLTRMVRDHAYLDSLRAAARANPPGPTVDGWVGAVLECGGG